MGDFEMLPTEKVERTNAVNYLNTTLKKMSQTQKPIEERLLMFEQSIEELNEKKLLQWQESKSKTMPIQIESGQSEQSIEKAETTSSLGNKSSKPMKKKGGKAV